MRVTSRSGTVGLLEPVRLLGGGMIQGLSISLTGYTLIPAHLDVEFLSSIPLACPRVPPALLDLPFSV